MVSVVASKLFCVAVACSSAVCTSFQVLPHKSRLSQLSLWPSDGLTTSSGCTSSRAQRLLEMQFPMTLLRKTG